MRFAIQTVSRVPIHVQLTTRIREAIARGDLRPGERLPSVRQMSRDLVINPNTVAKVYTELEREGLVHSRPGVGAFIAAPKDDLSEEARRDRLGNEVDRLLTEAVHLGFSAREVVRLVTRRAQDYAWTRPGRTVSQKR